MVTLHLIALFFVIMYLKLYNMSLQYETLEPQWNVFSTPLYEKWYTNDRFDVINH